MNSRYRKRPINIPEAIEIMPTASMRSSFRGTNSTSNNTICIRDKIYSIAHKEVSLLIKNSNKQIYYLWKSIIKVNQISSV